MPKSSLELMREKVNQAPANAWFKQIDKATGQLFSIQSMRLHGDAGLDFLNATRLPHIERIQITEAEYKEIKERGF